MLYHQIGEVKLLSDSNLRNTIDGRAKLFRYVSFEQLSSPL